MSVWCELSGIVYKPYKYVSLRKLAEETFESCCFEMESLENFDSVNISFISEGVQAAKEIEHYCNVLKANKIRCDLVAQIRFLT